MIRNFISQKDILQNPSLEEWKSSKVAFNKRDIWLDKTKGMDNELKDSFVKLRGMDIRTQQGEYEETLQFAMAKYFKDFGAKAVMPSDPKAVMPNIQFTKNVDAAATASLANNPLGGNVALATYNNPLLTYNNMIIGMYDQITPTNVSPIMTDFSESMYPAVGLYIASWAAITGMTMTQSIGQPFYNVAKREVDYQFFKTTSYAEKAVYHQEEVIGLRNPESNSFMDRGLPLYMAKNMAMIEHRRQTRNIFDIYRAIYDGVFYFNGAALSYNINPANRLTGSQLGGAPWASFSATSNGVTSFGNVNIPQAFRNLAHGVLRKYTGYTLKFYMNSLTLSSIIGNPSITPITNFGPGTQVGTGRSVGDSGQLESILKQFLGTSVNIEIVIDDSQYIADSTDPLGRAAGTEVYLNDVGKIFVAPQVQATGAGMGQYAYTPIVQNGGMYNPQPGAAFFMIDTFASNTVEGMENPSLSQAVRFSAMPLIFRNNDLFTIDITQ